MLKRNLVVYLFFFVSVFVLNMIWDSLTGLSAGSHPLLKNAISSLLTTVFFALGIHYYLKYRKNNK